MADLPSSVTGAPRAAASDKPPGVELGAVRQSTGFDGWMAFMDEAEYVPQLSFPSSVQTYHKMRSDSQIEALHLGTVQPIREFRWMIDPNKAPKQIVENAATDLGLPLKGEDPEEAGIKRVSNKFGFDRFLSDVLLGPLYGFMHFEIVGYLEEAERWRMRKLAPRHPRTIQQFREDDHGELSAIKQIFGPQMATTPPEIPASKLLSFVWRPEAGTITGRSMLRSMYREWLVKDRVLRSGAINIQRAGGVPVAYAAQGASDKQIEDLAQMARQFKVAEGGGGAFPFGTKLELVGGSVPDAITMLRYCDECMARVWALMLVQLGQTETGSRALGGEFAIYAARAQRLMAKWVAEVVNDFLDRYVEWNEPFADYAPLLCFEPSKPEGLSVTDLVSLLDAGALTVDPELEEWLRAEFSLPDKPEPPEHPDLGELSPDEVALVQSKRNPPVLPDGTPATPGAPAEPSFKQTPLPKKALDPTVTMPTIARTGTRDLPRLHRGIRASLTLPDRKLRRAPTANEIRAAVDFRALDEAHAATVARLHHDYLNGTLPTQIEHLADQIRAGVKPADLKAPIPERGLERMRGHLSTAAESGVHTAVREAEAQGVVIGAEHRAALLGAARDRAAAQAEHVATMNANGLTLGAQRRAGRLSAKVVGRERRAKDLESHLKGQKHVFERENLKGAATMAQNTGRLAAFEAIAQATAGEGEAATATYEASEILDDRTCVACEAVDGTVYEDLDAAEADYASGGYVDCEGGPNCRGTLVAIYPEQNPMGGEGPLREAEPGYTQPGGGGEALPEVPEVAPPGPEPEPVSGMEALAEAAASFDASTASADDAGALGDSVLTEAQTRHAGVETQRESARVRMSDAEQRWSAASDRQYRDPAEQARRREEVPIHERGPNGAIMREAAEEIAQAREHLATLPEWHETLLGVLGEVREMGGEVKVERGARVKVREATQSVARVFPKAWIERSNEAMPLKLSERTGKRSQHSFSLERRTKVVGDKTYFRIPQSVVEMGAQAVNDDAHGVLAHELMHRMQMAVPGLHRLEREFYDAKTAGEETRRLSTLRPGMNYGPSEVARPDEFTNAYSGKWYEDFGDLHHDDEGVWMARPSRGEGNPAEVLPMGLQKLMQGELAQDDQSRFVLGLLAGL